MNIKLSDTIVIADPCYSRELTHCAAFNYKIKPGNYAVSVEYSDEGAWGIRVKSLAIFHESVKISRHGFKLNKSIMIGVDSGQAGFFCDSIYPEGETGDYSDKNSFYGQCCAATHEDDKFSFVKRTINHYKDALAIYKDSNSPLTVKNLEEKIAHLEKELEGEKPSKKPMGYNSIMGAGVVSSTGFGDGGYSLYEKKNAAGEVVALKIKYI